MRKLTGVKVILLCAGLFCLSLQNVCAAGFLKESSGQSGQAADLDFTLETVSGKEVALKDFEGKPMILFFFTTWCPYCRQKIAALPETYQQYKKEGIEFLLIDLGESRYKVKSFVDDKKLPYDVLLDIKTEMTQAYGIVGVPTFVLIAKDGHVAYSGNDLPRDYNDLLK
jgi:cytochrome c biogenesis protein CcmG, thiol:disulfide interchange protein DsbE